MRALIENNTAVAVSEHPEQEFHPTLAAQFIDVPDDVRQGWQIIEGVWTAPQIPTPLPVVPYEVTMRQARLELLSRGKLDYVQPAIDSIQDPIEKQAAQIEWDFSNAVQRHHPFVIGLGEALGLNLDEVFIEAAKR